jgi:hypothetical protein
MGISQLEPEEQPTSRYRAKAVAKSRKQHDFFH